MSGVRATRKKPAKSLLKDKLTFVEFLEVWNAMEGQTTPAFHYEIAQWLEDTDAKPTRLLMAFRDASKSWLISCFIAWKLSIDPNETFIMISAVQELATRNATFVRDIIERHPATKHLVPKGETELWRRNTFTVERDKSPGFPTVQALTLFGDWTGRHARHLFADDIETMANAESAETRNAVRARIKQFRSMCPRVTWIGTPHWGKQSLYLPLLSRADCMSVQYPAWQDGPDPEKPEEGRVYTWPERREISDPDALALKRVDLGEPEFRSQYLLEFEDMQDGGLELSLVHEYTDGLIRNAQRHWFDTADRITATIAEHSIISLVAAWDPASGKNDDSVYACVGRSNKDRTFIHRTEKLPQIDHTGWAKQTDRIITLMKADGVTKIVVETNTNPALPAELRMAAQRAGYKITVIGVHNTLKKELRVRLALENTISAGKLHIHANVLQSKFASQARDFPQCMKGKRENDFLDAAAFGVLHLRKLPPGVTVSGSLNDWSSTGQVASARAVRVARGEQTWRT